jgi:hypothetical protein
MLISFQYNPYFKFKYNLIVLLKKWLATEEKMLLPTSCIQNICMFYILQSTTDIRIHKTYKFFEQYIEIFG